MATKQLDQRERTLNKEPYGFSCPRIPSPCSLGNSSLGIRIPVLVAPVFRASKSVAPVSRTPVFLAPVSLAPKSSAPEHRRTDLGETVRESFEDSLHFAAAFHGDDPVVILFVDPDEEVLGFIMPVGTKIVRHIFHDSPMKMAVFVKICHIFF